MTEEKEWNIPCFCAYTAPLTTTVSYFWIRAAKQGMDMKQTPWLSSQWEGKVVLTWSLDLAAPSHPGGPVEVPKDQAIFLPHPARN